jgi:hypothetical protein
MDSKQESLIGLLLGLVSDLERKSVCGPIEIRDNGTAWVMKARSSEEPGDYLLWSHLHKPFSLKPEAPPEGTIVKVWSRDDEIDTPWVAWSMGRLGSGGSRLAVSFRKSDDTDLYYYKHWEVVDTVVGGDIEKAGTPPWDSPSGPRPVPR